MGDRGAPDRRRWRGANDFKSFDLGLSAESVGSVFDFLEFEFWDFELRSFFSFELDAFKLLGFGFCLMPKDEGKTESLGGKDDPRDSGCLVIGES